MKTNSNYPTIKGRSAIVLLVIVAIVSMFCSISAAKSNAKADIPADLPTQETMSRLNPVLKELPMVLPSTTGMVSEPSKQLTPCVVPRYAGVTMTDAEREELAAIVYLEARNQSAEGQQAVVEVVFNRVVADNFPDTVHEVLKQEGQFSTWSMLDSAYPGDMQYAAIHDALYGPTILDEDVVFFARSPENSRVWGRIEDHVFCRQYIWE